MVTLPQLDSYSKAEWETLEKRSPISSIYRKLLEQKASQFDEQLRQDRHRAWLECAFATFLKVHHPQKVCAYWSQKSENLILKAWHHHGLDKQPIQLLAFGKLGSRELNLSSDIDIVFVATEPTSPLLLKPFIQSLNAVTEWGFCFRVDTDLRPGGPSSPLMPTIDTFIHYYGYHGEPWHRLSFIRCRPLTVSEVLPKELSSFLSNYSFPRRLDYRILNAVRGLRQKIHQSENEDIHLKLAPGGIRDIEFLVQSMQLLYGGRIEPLQTPSIQKALDQLLLHKRIPKKTHLFFSAFYWQLRAIENALQCHQDLHTYTLREEHLGILDLDISFVELKSLLSKSEALISEYFSDAEIDNRPSLPPQSTNINIGLSLSTKEALNEFLSSSRSSPLSSEDKKNKDIVFASFLEKITENDIDKDLAMQTFIDFLEATQANSSLYYILANNIKIIEQLAWIFSFSPYTGRILSSRPELIDSFAIGTVEIDPKTQNTDKFIEDLMDYKLLNKLSSISYFLKNGSVPNLSAQVSTCADTIAKNIIHFLGQKYSQANIDILCLGKWGGSELGLRSDLDFIFVTKENPTTDDFQIAKRFVNLISYPSKSGTLYNVDLRLKPQSGGGPLIVAFENLKDFLSKGAKNWQKQAYLKGRFLFQQNTIYEAINISPIVGDNFENELEQILENLFRSSGPNAIDLKYGRGGLVHTEFLIQKKLMGLGKWTAGPSTEQMLDELPSTPVITDQIRKNYFLFRQASQLNTILTGTSTSTLKSNSSSLKKLERLLGHSFQDLQNLMNLQRDLLKELDANY